MKKLIFLIAIIFIAGNSCLKKNDIEADRQFMIKIVKDWDMNFLTSGSYEANAEYYTKDAVRIHDGKVFSGKEAIRNEFNRFSKEMKFLKLEDKVEDMWISGDLSTLRGSFSESIIRKEVGDTINNKGVWVSVFKRQPDGSWKMVHTLVTLLKD